MFFTEEISTISLILLNLVETDLSVLRRFKVRDKLQTDCIFFNSYCTEHELFEKCQLLKHNIFLLRSSTNISTVFESIIRATSR